MLVIHGRRDRHAPYGGGKDWATLLPNARLITTENAAHLPWIESSEVVFGAIKVFLDGDWPDGRPTARWTWPVCPRRHSSPMSTLNGVIWI